MNWIKLRTNLIEDPAVYEMSDILYPDLDIRADQKSSIRYQIVGQLSDIWGWIGDNSADGVAQNVSTKIIDARVSCPGFSSAMAQVGWLTVEERGVSMPKWDRHNSSSAKARALEAEAKAIRRRNEKSDPKTCPTKSTQNVRPDKRREDKNINTPLPPKGDASAQFQLATSDQLPASAESSSPAIGKKKKGRRNAAQTPPSDLVAAIYDAYPLKVKRPDAIRAIEKALASGFPVDRLLHMTQLFAAAVAQWGSARYSADGRDCCPHPATWFNAERYTEDPTNWEMRPKTQKKEEGGGILISLIAAMKEPNGWQTFWPEVTDMPLPASWHDTPPEFQRQIMFLCQNNH